MTETDWHLNRFQFCYEPGIGYRVDRVLYDPVCKQPLVRDVEKQAVFVYEADAKFYCAVRNAALKTCGSDAVEAIGFELYQQQLSPTHNP